MDDLERLFSKIPNWFRWMLVPITAVVTALIVWFIANIGAKIIVFFDGGRGWGENFFQYLVIPGIGTYCSVVTGVAMAPRYKNSAALVLGMLWCFGAGSLTFLSVLTSVWANVITVVSMCFGTGIATLSQFSEPDGCNAGSGQQLDASPAE